ncbi:hypothetical protein U0070_011156 [Myodes glareolus]|uniref:Uncharacterized protein n=1 Tax=Myodes glareolus TaxID=447135 RepID=A0AAW0HEN1_MYOGA
MMVSDEDYEEEEEEELYNRPVKATSLPALGQDSSSISLPTFLVAGGSLVFGLLLCVFIILRLKRTWKSPAVRESKASSPPPYSLGQLKPAFTLVPLLASAGPHNSSRPDSCPGVRDLQSPYDTGNRDGLCHS